MHQTKRLTFWQHHALMLMVTIPALALIRGVGNMANIGSATNYLLHSAIVVGVSYPLITASAYSAMRFFPTRIPIQYRAVGGCVLVAPLLSFLMPVISWFVGVGPDHIISSQNRRELFVAIMERQPGIMLAFAFIGAFLWMGLNFSWWQGVLSEGEASELRALEEPDRNEAAPSTEPDLPKFLTKLPFSKRGDLWGLSSELHYVRVYTSRGNDLILMRLTDAIDQSETVVGLQVHRSHWVANDGVKAVRNTGGKMRIVLKNDEELPVSRSHHGAVRNALGHLIE